MFFKVGNLCPKEKKMKIPIPTLWVKTSWNDRSFRGDSPHPQLPFGGFWWNTDKLSDAVPAPFCPAPFQHGSQPNLPPDRWRNEQSQRPIKSSCHPPTKPQRHTWRTWTYLNGTLFCKRWSSNCWVSNKYPADPILFNIGTTSLLDLSSLRKVAPLSLRGFHLLLFSAHGIWWTSPVTEPWKKNSGAFYWFYCKHDSIYQDSHADEKTPLLQEVATTMGPFFRSLSSRLGWSAWS